jgi:hypothetical protein
VTKVWKSDITKYVKQEEIERMIGWCSKYSTVDIIIFSILIFGILLALLVIVLMLLSEFVSELLAE